MNNNNLMLIDDKIGNISKNPKAPNKLILDPLY